MKLPEFQNVKSKTLSKRLLCIQPPPHPIQRIPTQRLTNIQLFFSKANQYQGNKSNRRTRINHEHNDISSDDYNYQISNGVEAAIYAIPLLIREYPDEKEDFI